MYKTSGYFKGVPCPYYASGLCERPYCHFGHFKNEDPQKKDEEETTTQTPQGTKTANTFQKLDQVKWYKPTPIPKLVNRSHKHKYVKPKNAPEYKPTPLHLLKKQNSCDLEKHVKSDQLKPTVDDVPAPLIPVTTYGKKTNVVAPQIQVPTTIPVIPVEKVETTENEEEINNKDFDIDKLVILNIKKEQTNNDLLIPYEENNVDVCEKNDQYENKDNLIKEENIESDINDNSNLSSLPLEVSGNACNKTSTECIVIDADDAKDLEITDLPESKCVDESKTSSLNVCNILSENNLNTSNDYKVLSKVNSNDTLTDKECNKDEPKEKSETHQTHHCTCHHAAKTEESEKHKRHKSSSSSKSSHKKKKKSAQKKKKKKKHKSSDKKKRHSPSSSEESSSDDNEDSEDTSVHNHHSSRSRKHSKDSDKSSSKKRHHSSSSSSSESRSRHSSTKKHKRSHSKAKKSRGKHSKTPKKRHHRSSSRSSSCDRKHAKHSKSSKTEKIDLKKKNKAKDSQDKRSHSNRILNSENFIELDDITSQENKTKNDTNKSESTKEKASSKANVPLKLHSNIFDSISKVVNDAMKEKKYGKDKLKVPKDETISNNDSTSKTSKTTKNNKPDLLKSISTVDLFGDDSSGNELEIDKKSSMHKPIISASTKPTTSQAPDSDSDSIVLSSDSEPAHALSNTEPTCPTIDLDDVDLSDGDPFEECMQIFNETQVQSKAATPQKETSAEPKPDSENECISSHGKKREAHKQSSHIKSSTQQRVEAQRHAPRPSAAQVMHSRMLDLQNKTKEEHIMAKPKKTLFDPFAKRSRVAHAPKPTPQSTSSKASKDSKDRTQSPKKRAAKRPIIPEEFGSKVPTKVRQQYLNKMIDDCLKIYTEDQDAYDRALAEEKAVYQRSNNKAIYMRVAVNAIKKLRDEVANHSLGGGNRSSVSHTAVLGGLKAATTSFTLNRTGKSPRKFSVEIFMRHIQAKYVLNDEQLVENRFPRNDPDKAGNALLFLEEKYKSALTSDKDKRHCVRCGKSFQVNYKGEYVRSEQCIYHWGKAWKTRIARGVWENKWTCCGGDLGTKGCQVCKAHVHEYNKIHDTEGFVKTLSSSTVVDWENKAYALDCEMVYTIAGSQLARVTVVDYNCETVLEKLVKPSSPVIDYNTRFSGITENDLKGVKTTLRDIQAILLSLFTDKTILIGHSLESDLLALKMIHSSVVDTSVVFPHKLGPPYKRALKTLMGEILQKIIQEDVDGHDSLEDAASAMQLIVWKVKDDLKHNRISM